jgi:hypothetical protein
MKGLFVLASAMLAGACAVPPAVSAARRGDSAAVARAIEPELRSGRLQNDEATAIARAVAEHALEASKGEEARDRVRDLRSCAGALVSALEDRSEIHDAAGAEAATALLEIGDLDASDARKWLRDPSDDWRAVGARGLVREEDAAARAKALLDPSVKVRRASMRASAEAKAAGDVPGLLEAARVDPDLLARSEAVRAIARIDPASADVVHRLHDLWSTSDDALREDIARAWVSPHLLSSGGAEELRVLLAAGHGPGVVNAAALIVMRARTSGSAAPPAFDDETQKSAVAVLVRTVDQAPRRDRLLAIAMAPLSNAEVAAAVKRASGESNDLETRESALSRLLEVASEHDAAKKALIAFASPGSPELLARRARLALAADGEIAVQAWIEADLKSPDPSTKLLAASALASLHRVARAAPLLADPDAHVRTAAACTVLAAR